MDVQVRRGYRWKTLRNGQAGKINELRMQAEYKDSVPENIDAEVLSGFLVRSPRCTEKIEFFIVQTAKGGGL